MAKISKILYLITQSEWGGAQRYIFDLATNLPLNRYEISVAAGGNQKLHTKLDEKNIKSYKLKNLVREINPIKDLKAYFEIKRLLKEVKPDILHLNSSKAGIIGAIASKHAGVKKIIYTVHGFVFNEPMPSWKKQIYLWAEKFSTRYKNKLICVSEFDRQTGIKNKISVKKLVTINNGINQMDFLSSQQAKTELNLPKNKIIIGTIANFYPTKGLTYFIQAAKTVNQQFPNAFFAIIGDGEQRNQLELEIKSLKLENNLILLGKKEKAWQYLPAFDIYICSSVKEGFPYSVLEAMAAGLPIVGTKVGGIPEMINDGETGLLVEPANPDEMAQKIIYLLKNKNLAEQFSRQTQNDVLENFDLEKMIRETEKIYRE